MARRDISYFYCAGCDYLGAASSYYYEVVCPECKKVSLDGEWVKLCCMQCEYTCTVFQPGGNYAIYEHCEMPMTREPPSASA